MIKNLILIKKSEQKNNFALFVSFFNIWKTSCKNIKKRRALFIHTFSWRIWICNQILKIFILKFSFSYTFCQFHHSRTEPRILKIVFFFLQHDNRWTLQQYGTVICFLATKVSEKNGSNIEACTIIEACTWTSVEACTYTHGRKIQCDEAPKVLAPPLQPIWLNENSFWKLFWVIKGNMNGVIRGNYEIVPRTLKFITFYSIFFTFLKMYILWVKVLNFKVLVRISKFALMTPFVFPLVTQNDFQWKISVSQYGCRGGGANFFLLLAPHHALFCVHV